jgi:hypothetical protein
MSEVHSILNYIETTQADGRLLLRFVARRSDRTLADVGEVDRGIYAVLFDPPAQVAQDRARLGALLGCIDTLSQRAAPANVRSIRLTSTYLGIAMEDGEPPPGIRSEAGWIRFYMGLVAVLAVVLLVIGVGLLAHMDAGRRLLLQLKELRQQEEGVAKDIATLALTESVALGVMERRTPAEGGRVAISAIRVTPALVPQIAALFGKTAEEALEWQGAAPMCGKPLYLGGAADDRYSVTFVKSEGVDLSTFALSWWREPVTAKAAAICGRHDDLRVRLALLYTGLADWNCASHQMFAPMIGLMSLPYTVAEWVSGKRRMEPVPACGGPTGRLPPEVGIDAWRSHETQVTLTSSVVSGFLLPLFLGSLGGCAYAMRRIDQKLSGWTLEPQDGRHAVVRVALAAVLGGLLGVVWTSGEPLALGGFSLSLAAAAFFIGFAVEPVFRMIETTVIDGLIKKAGGPVPAGDKPAPPPA